MRNFFNFLLIIFKMKIINRTFFSFVLHNFLNARVNINKYKKNKE